MTENNDFNEVAGIENLPNTERFDEETLDETARYFSVRNYGRAKIQSTNIAEADYPYLPSGISNQDFLYTMCDFANRHSLETIVAKGSIIIITGSADIPKLMKKEFGETFLVEPRNAKLLKFLLKEDKRSASLTRQIKPIEPS